MYIWDLIYGGAQYMEELLKIFPGAKIENAEDEVHEGRISLEIQDIDEKQYWKSVCLNGFMAHSLIVTMIAMDPERKQELKDEFEKWRTTNPECFKQRSKE